MIFSSLKTKEHEKKKNKGHKEKGERRERKKNKGPQGGRETL